MWYKATDNNVSVRHRHFSPKGGPVKVIEILNIRATPHVKVRAYPTTSTNRWSRNDFTDPEDDEVWDEDDLTPVERGHVYLWKEDDDGWIHIFMPFKIMDEETGILLRGFQTFRSTAPFVTGRNHALDKLTKNPKSCLQNFKFTKEYFNTFKKKVKAIDGVVEKDEIDVEALLSHIQETRETVKALNSTVASLRTTYCVASSEVKLDTREKLEEALKQFSMLRDSFRESGKERVVLAKILSRLKEESGRKTAYIEASEWFSVLTKELNLVRSADFDRLEREAVHKHRVDIGDLDMTSRPPTLMALGVELDRLKQYFPCLIKLKVVNTQNTEAVYLDLPGIKISLLSDGAVKVEGDPAVLKPFVEGSSAVQAAGRRRRTIYTEDEN